MNLNSENIITGRGLQKSFWMDRQETPVLRGIDIEIERRSLMVILGASGAGKSTLLHVLSSLDEPSSGDVFFEGNNLYQHNDEELSRLRNQSIGFVFQFHHLMPEFTALENVMMPLLMRRESKSEATKKSLELLERLGLAGRTSHRPTELSGGEQQRVAVARALVTSPKVLFADEPTGNLDQENSEKLMQLFLEIYQEQEMALVLVTHNDALAEQFSTKVYLEDGRIGKVKKS